MQVLMLVGARWMAGLLFRWSDLAILDDPIPEKLYCQHFRNKNNKNLGQPDQSTKLSELESGVEEENLDAKPEGGPLIENVAAYFYQ